MPAWGEHAERWTWGPNLGPSCRTVLTTAPTLCVHMLGNNKDALYLWAYVCVCIGVPALFVSAWAIVRAVLADAR